MGVLSRLRAKLAPQSTGKKKRTVQHAVPFDSQAQMKSGGRFAINQFPQPKKNLPQAVKDQFDALSIQAASTRQQLDILRQTRGSRNVGTVKVPPHLQTGDVLDGRGVERRGDVATFVLPEN